MYKHSLPFSHTGGFCWNRRVKPQHMPIVATAASREMKSCTKQYEDFLTNCSVYRLVFWFGVFFVCFLVSFKTRFWVTNGLYLLSTVNSA